MFSSTCHKSYNFSPQIMKVLSLAPSAPPPPRVSPVPPSGGSQLAANHVTFRDVTGHPELSPLIHSDS